MTGPDSSSLLGPGRGPILAGWDWALTWAPLLSSPPPPPAAVHEDTIFLILLSDSRSSPENCRQKKNDVHWSVIYCWWSVVHHVSVLMTRLWCESTHVINRSLWTTHCWRRVLLATLHGCHQNINWAKSSLFESFEHIRNVTCMNNYRTINVMQTIEVCHSIYVLMAPELRSFAAFNGSWAHAFTHT